MFRQLVSIRPGVAFGMLFFAVLVVACNDDEPSLGELGQVCREATDDVAACDDGLVCERGVCLLDESADGDDDLTSEGGDGQACRGWVEPCDPACNADQYCDDGTCRDVIGCERLCDAATEYCDVTKGECTRIPDSTDDMIEPCDDGLICVDGVCRADTADGDDDVTNEGAEGQACRGWNEPCDPSCNADQYCDDGTCRDIIRCEQQCDVMTQYCDITRGECVTIPDSSDYMIEPCDDDLICIDGICVVDGGDWPADCSAGEFACQGDSIYECDADGEWSFYFSCSSQGNYVCRNGICEPSGFTPDGDDDSDEPVCVDEYCPGAELCNERNECEVLCVYDTFNENCAGENEFATIAYGECERVPCRVDKDCLGLEACDDPEAGSQATFACNDDSVCQRIGR